MRRSLAGKYTENTLRNKKLLKKMKNPDPAMVAKLNSKAHLQNLSFDFLSCFALIWFQNLQKMQICKYFAAGVYLSEAPSFPSSFVNGGLAILKD